MPRQKQTKRAENSQETPEWLESFINKQEEISRRREEEHRKREEESQKRILELQEQLLRQPQNQSNSRNERVEKLPTASKPSTLEVDITYGKFTSWRESWEDYATLTRLEYIPLPAQRAHFRSCLSDDMRHHIKNAIGITEQEDLNINEILDKIQSHPRKKKEHCTR